jgi:hypothetical protein
MSDGGFGGSCGGNEGCGSGNNSGGYGYGCGQGFDVNGCVLPSFVLQQIDDAGTNCNVGSGGDVSSNGCWGSDCGYSNQQAGANLSKVGSGVSYSTKGAATATTVDVTSCTDTDKTIVLGNGAGDQIGDGSGTYDTFVAGNGGGDKLFDNGTGSKNSLFDGNGNGDTLRVDTGTYNWLQAGDGAGDLATLGYSTFVAPPPNAASTGNVLAGTALANNNNLLELGNGAGDTIAVGDGNNNSLIAGTGAVINLAEGATTITQTGGDNISVLNGNNNLLSSADVASNTLGATLYVGDGDGNVMQAGNSNYDTITVETGSNNSMTVGNGNHDSILNGGGDPATISATTPDGVGNTMVAGGGKFDTVSFNSSDGSCITVGDGCNDTVLWDTGNGTSVGIGDGNTDLVTFGTGSNNSIYTGVGTGDTVTWSSGNANLVCMGDGSGDVAGFEQGSCNAVTLGNGCNDSINLNFNGEGSFNSLSVGNGNNDVVGVDGDNNLLQSGCGNNDVLGIGISFGVTGDVNFLSGYGIGFGNNNVIEAGNGTGDALFGGIGNDTLVAGGGLGNASDSSSGSWSGTWGDTLTGNGTNEALNAVFDPTGQAAVLNPYDNGMASDTYVLNCQGGDLIQDISADLNDAVVVNFAGASSAQSYCGVSSPSAINAIDDTSIAYSAANYTSSSDPSANANEDWNYTQVNSSYGTLTLGIGTVNQTAINLFGQFSASGFSFASDTGIENAEATYQSTGVGSLVGSSNYTYQAGDLLVSYSAQGSSSCGSQSNNGCGGGQSSGGSGSCGSSSGGSSCGVQSPCVEQNQFFAGCGA